MFEDLNARTRDILKLVIDSYLETGQPVGSKMIAARMGTALSPATIRNVMAELEALGLLYAPHTSAGRIPTDQAYSIFVDRILEITEPPQADRRAIESRLDTARDRPIGDIVDDTLDVLSGLSSYASLIVVPKADSALRQVDFVKLSPSRVLTVLVSQSGTIENRVVDMDEDVPVSVLQRTANYLTDKFGGLKLHEAAARIELELANLRRTIDDTAARLAAKGFADVLPHDTGGHIVVRGQSRLLEDITALEDLARVKSLFDELESKDMSLKLLGAIERAEDVQIFIGARNNLFSHAGCALILSPLKDMDQQVIGAIGVIGPSRLNYGRVIPIVNFTARTISRLK